MSSKQSKSAFFAVAALSLACAASASLGTGCVGDRPSRNGVYNENVYLRKSFLVRPGTGGAEDNGWYFKATVIDASTPNPLANLDFWPGAESGGALVRFVLTNDKLQMVNLKEISHAPDAQAQRTRTGEVTGAWPASHVDLKYRVSMDGEKTNFYEENQELAWQTRQWVKVSLAKNDLGELAPWGQMLQYFMERCVDTAHVSTTLVPDSLRVEEDAGYLSWKVSVTLPVQFDDEACVQGYGEEGAQFQKLGRSQVTMTVMYSLARAPDAQAMTYRSLQLAEKDPIKRKYGPIRAVTIARDNDSQLLSARELVWRYDPAKEIRYFFAPGYPEKYKKYFTGPQGIVEQTNAVFVEAGLATRLVVEDYDEDLAPGEPPREVGDVRYSFIRWQSDLDVGAPFLGVAQFVADPRTGETVSTSINIADYPLKDFVVRRIDAYLQTIGASLGVDAGGAWQDGPPGCQDGDTMPLVPLEVAKNHNGRSSLFNKIQEYLGKPVAQFGSLGPQDFVAPQDELFWGAYWGVVPYLVYADPEANPYVIPEGGAGVFGPSEQWKLLQREAAFHEMARAIDRGKVPYALDTGTESVKSAAAFLDNLQKLTLDHHDYEYRRQFRARRTNAQFDTADVLSLTQVMARAARHCKDGRWETRDEWIEGLLDTYHAQTVWHEFGHVLGLEHNFMGSVDRPNYPHYKDKAGRDHVGLYSSTVMEYNNTADRVAWANERGVAGWGPYDRAAIAWIYSNDASTHKADADRALAKGVSGQVSKDAPWRDPLGWRSGAETQFLFCTHEHIRYTPLCRQFDFGSTPSEIVAAELDNYEWQYRWRNFRTYRKYWDNSQYATVPANEVYQIRRFLPMWGFDWNEPKLIDTWRRIGVRPPPGTASEDFWYDNLVDKFTNEMSTANQLVAAFHKAVIQQASGERPYRSIYDDFYGDVTQQGIILDKLFAMQGFVAMWPSDNYDPDQAGSFIASYSSLGDERYRAIAEDAVTSMIGEQYYDAYPYFKPLAVVQFQKDTHSQNFGGRIEVRDWAGGYVFTRQRDMLDFFRNLAVANGGLGCKAIETCTYDPTVARVAANDLLHSDVLHEFTGPDKRRWAWVYVQDRNAWIFADRDRNTATYKIVNDYVLEVIRQEQEEDAAYALQLPLKYFLDAYTLYN